nr:MAG TPA: Nicotinamide riboside transporter PnuC transport, vitamin transport, Nicotinamide [Caudoviricetes sp.]
MIDITWFLTAISLTGTILNIQKNILCFYVWLIGDILWCALDFCNGTYGRSLLDFVQVILAVCGIVSWQKKIEVE